MAVRGLPSGSQAAGLKLVMEKRDSLTDANLEKESGRASDS